MLMRATFSPRMPMADRQETAGAISQEIASVPKDPDLLVACAVAAIGLAASFAFMLAIATDSATLLAQIVG
jgi:hypothetical protein